MKLYKRVVIKFILILMIGFLSGCQQAVSSNGDGGTDAPKVDSFDPASGTTDIAADCTITIVFSEEMDGSTTTTDSINLYHSSGSEVIGEVTFDTDTAVFIPNNNLEYGVEYRIEILNMIKDTKGNNLDKDYSSTFTVIDIPVVSKFDPASGSDNIAPDHQITVTFSREMDSETINTSSIMLVDQTGTEIQGDVTFDTDTAIFTPDSYLEKDTDYTIHVLDSIKDLAGNHLDKEYDSTFTVVFRSYDKSVEMIRNIEWEFDLSTNMDSTTDVSYEILSLPDHGNIALSGHTVAFDPVENFTGTDSFTFRANNGIDISETYTVDVTIVHPLFSDTDQDGDFSDNHGEDSDFNINPQSFTYNDASEDTVIDQVTDLIWQKTHNGAFDTVNDAIAVCNNLVLGGYDDWRLPGIKELMFVTLWDDSSSQLNAIFTETGKVDYWAKESVPKQGDSGFYWLDDSFKSTFGLIDSGYSWCVRGQEKNPKFIENGNGTVRDTATGLTWQQQTSERDDWDDAIDYCDDLTLANKNDWRLPNVKELFSLIDFTTENPSIDMTFFPNTSQNYYWTSTAADSGTNAAMGINFKNAISNWLAWSFSTGKTRCVRGE